MAAILTKSLTRTSAIGLDVGTSGIRAVQLKSAPGRIVLQRVLCWEDRQVITGTAETSSPQPRLDQVLQQESFHGHAAISGLCEPDLQLHPLGLAADVLAGPANTLETTVRAELERLANCEGDSTQVAHWPLPPSRSSGVTALGVITRNEMVQELLDRISQAGLDCCKVDAAACALPAMGRSLLPGSDQQIWGALDMGYRSARLIVCVGDVPVLARSFDAGGRLWTERIAEVLDISVEAAECHKRDCGIERREKPRDTNTSADLVHQRIAGLLWNSLKQNLQSISSEIQKSYEYVMQCYPDRALGRLILVGGGASSRNLDSHFKSTLGIEVSRVSDLIGESSIEITKSEVTGETIDRSALALAYALQSVTDRA